MRPAPLIPGGVSWIDAWFRPTKFCLALTLLTACNEMQSQPRDNDYRASALFADGKVMQAPPEGTVARDDPARAADLAHRPAMTPALLQRGRERYAVFCVPCHDAAGT